MPPVANGFLSTAPETWRTVDDRPDRRQVAEAPADLGVELVRDEIAAVGVGAVGEGLGLHLPQARRVAVAGCRSRRRACAPGCRRRPRRSGRVPAAPSSAPARRGRARGRPRALLMRSIFSVVTTSPERRLSSSPMRRSLTSLNASKALMKSSKASPIVSGACLISGARPACLSVIELILLNIAGSCGRPARITAGEPVSRRGPAASRMPASPAKPFAISARASPSVSPAPRVEPAFQFPFRRAGGRMALDVGDARARKHGKGDDRDLPEIGLENVAQPGPGVGSAP